MSQTQQTSRHDDRPLAASDAAVAPARSGFVVRGRGRVVGGERAGTRMLGRTRVTYVVVRTSAGAPAA